MGDEFERRPASIGKHILWLTASIESPSGVQIVDDLFPLSKLAELAKKHGSRSYSTDAEKNAVMKVIDKFDPANPTRESSNRNSSPEEVL